MYFDSHAHLTDERFAPDRDAVVAKLRAAGVSRVMNPGCDPASSMAAVELARQQDGFYAAVGSHPDDAGRFCAETLCLYRTLAREKKVRAIGEIGLDYHYDDNPPDVQKVCFRAQLELARELDMPVILHVREAHGDALEMLKGFPELRGVFHCYSGSAEEAAQLVKMGFYIGFTGVVTFKNARKAVLAASSVPLERILIETDCPYMAPEPHRGERNDPSLVPLVAAKIAEIRGISVTEVAEKTAQNACRLFGI